MVTAFGADQKARYSMASCWAAAEGSGGARSGRGAALAAVSVPLGAGRPLGADAPGGPAAGATDASLVGSGRGLELRCDAGAPCSAAGGLAVAVRGGGSTHPWARAGTATTASPSASAPKSPNPVFTQPAPNSPSHMKRPIGPSGPSWLR